MADDEEAGSGSGDEGYGEHILQYIFAMSAPPRHAPRHCSAPLRHVQACLTGGCPVGDKGGTNVREQDRFLPIANISRPASLYPFLPPIYHSSFLQACICSAKPLSFQDNEKGASGERQDSKRREGDRPGMRVGVYFLHH